MHLNDANASAHVPVFRPYTTLQLNLNAISTSYSSLQSKARVATTCQKFTARHELLISIYEVSEHGNGKTESQTAQPIGARTPNASCDI